MLLIEKTLTVLMIKAPPQIKNKQNLKTHFQVRFLHQVLLDNEFIVN